MIVKADSLKDEVKKIRRIRDKWVAHKDEIAVKNPNKFLKDVGLKFEDITKLIRTADEIIQEHFPVGDLTSFGIGELFWATECPDDFTEKIEKAKNKLKLLKK